MVSSWPVTPAAGMSWRSAPPRARATAAALPVAADQEPHRPGPVERREGEADPLRRRLGGVGDADRDPVVDVELRVPGNSEATCPSGPMPSITTSNSPVPCSRSSAEYAAAPSSTSAASAGGRHLVHVGRVDADRVQERRPGLAGVAVGVVGGDEALVAPPDDHAAPSRPRRPGDSRATSRCTASAMVPPVSAMCGTSPAGLRVGEPAAAARRRRPWPARRRPRGPRSRGLVIDSAAPHLRPGARAVAA